MKVSLSFLRKQLKLFHLTLLFIFVSIGLKAQYSINCQSQYAGFTINYTDSCTVLICHIENHDDLPAGWIIDAQARMWKIVDNSTNAVLYDTEAGSCIQFTAPSNGDYTVTLDYHWDEWQLNPEIQMGDYNEVNSCSFSTSECPCLPEADFSFDQTGCTVNFNSPIADSYLWDFGNGNSSIEQNPSEIYLDNTTYEVKLITTINGVDYECVKKVTPNCSNICEDEEFEIGIEMVNCSTYIFSPPVVEGCEVVNYTWDFGDGSTSELKSPEYSYGEGGSYSVRVNILCEDGIEYYCEKIVEVSGFCYSEPICGVDENHISAGPINSALKEGTDPIYLKVYVSVLRETLVNGGQTLKDIKTGLAFMNEHFAPHNIIFVYECEIFEITDEQIKLEYNTNLDWKDLPVRDWDRPSLDINFMKNNHSFTHDDGIDIFIAPALTGQTSYVNNPLPNDRIWVADKEDLLDFTLSHEMGHCLGLEHTFYNTDKWDINPLDPDARCELVTEPDGKNKGDYVPDTPSDPSQFWRKKACGKVTVSLSDFYNSEVPGSCINSDWSGVLKDENGEPYTPFAENLMGYNYKPSLGGVPSSCVPNFTGGQADRMRTLIDMYIPHVKTDPTIVVDEIVYGIQSWSDDRYITGNLYIKPSAVLTIESGVQISFNRTSKIIIEPGGELQLRGTLTSGCGNSFWEGVEVQDGGITTPRTNNRGGIVMHRNSAIMNAKVAIRAPGNSSFGTGGKILCNGAKFINNKTGVVIAPYVLGFSRNPYPSNFIECEFEVNDAFPHTGRLDAHVRLNRVDGVEFKGCVFSNNSSFKTDDPLDYGYGIFSNNSNFTVKHSCSYNTVPCHNRTQFFQMGYGIHVQGGAKPFEVLSSDFRQCLVGVRNRGVTGGKLLFNKLYLGRGEDFFTSVGFAFEENIASYTCEENQFMTEGAKERENLFGILSHNTGINFKEIRRCTFDGLANGNRIQKKNFGKDISDNESGLLILCNDNSNNGTDIFVVDGESSLDWDLGEFNPFDNEFIPAGNTFENTQDDRANNQNFDQLLKYYTWENAPNEYFVAPIIRGNTQEILLSTAQNNSCVQRYFDPTDDDSSFGVSQLIQNYQEAESNLSSWTDNVTETGANHRNHYKSEMDKFAYKILIKTLKDSTGFKEEDLFSALRRFNSYQSELAIAKFNIDQDNWTSAAQILSDIPLNYVLRDYEVADLNNFNYIFNLVIEKDLYSLDSTTLANLNELDSIGGNSQTWVRNILTLNGAHYPLEFLESEEVQERSMVKPINKKVIPGLLTVFPNPASDYVQFISVSSEESQSLLIRDINGRVVFKNDNIAKNGKVDWLTQEYPSGVYFYQLFTKSKLLASGKVIVNK